MQPVNQHKSDILIIYIEAMPILENVVFFRRTRYMKIYICISIRDSHVISLSFSSNGMMKLSHRIYHEENEDTNR